MFDVIGSLLADLAKATVVVATFAATVYTGYAAWCVLRHNMAPGPLLPPRRPDVRAMNLLDKPVRSGTLSSIQRTRLLSRFLPALVSITAGLLAFSTLIVAPAAPAVENTAHLRTAITARPNPVLSAAEIAAIAKASAMKLVSRFPGRASNNANNRRGEWLDSDRSIKPGSTRAYAVLALDEYGWSLNQWACLDRLWWHESGWSPTGGDPDRAYGIPQAFPGSKMASEGEDWRNNPKTQVDWGMQYIKSRYKTPCGAFDAWSDRAAHGYGWY